jgi:hypothetical protein
LIFCHVWNGIEQQKIQRSVTIIPFNAVGQRFAHLYVQ